MYKRLKKICKENGTTITALCTEVTGNSANLATWKKGYMRSDYLSKCADVLKVSTDYLLDRTDNPTIYNHNNNSGFISTADNSRQTSNESGIVFQGDISGSPTINLAQPESTKNQLQNVIDHLLAEIEELKKIQKELSFDSLQ